MSIKNHYHTTDETEFLLNDETKIDFVWALLLGEVHTLGLYEPTFMEDEQEWDNGNCDVLVYRGRMFLKDGDQKGTEVTEVAEAFSDVMVPE